MTAKEFIDSRRIIRNKVQANFEDIYWIEWTWEYAESDVRLVIEVHKLGAFMGSKTVIFDQKESPPILIEIIKYLNELGEIIIQDLRFKKEINDYDSR